VATRSSDESVVTERTPSRFPCLPGHEDQFGYVMEKPSASRISQAPSGQCQAQPAQSQESDCLSGKDI